MKLLLHNAKSRLLGTKLKYPYAVQYNITYKCNLRCVYCDCGIVKHTNYEMTTAEIAAMVDEFAAMGTKRLSITGGEPLLKKNLGDVVRHARQRGLFVSVATNGTLVPRRIAELAEVSSFNLTLDGPEALHDLQRGKGTYREVVAAIEAIRGRGIPAYLNCVVTRNNCRCLPEILEIARNLDVKLLAQPVFYSAPSHAGNLEGYESVRIGDDDFADTLRFLIARKAAGDPTLLLSAKYYRDLLHYLRTGEKMKCSFARKRGSVYCTVSPEGYVTPCNLLVRDRRYLDGRELGFRRAFLEMPELHCGGCISSFIDIDYLLTLDREVSWNYVRPYFALARRRASPGNYYK